MQLTEFVEELKSRVDIVEVISEYVDLKKAGSQFKALCPFHPEKTPSFFVNPQRQFFHCFGCGAGGDVISFVMKQDGLEFMEALEVLAKRAGLSMDALRPQKGVKGLREALVEANIQALRFYQRSLRGSSEAMDYLKKRGISQGAIERFSLGYAPAGGNVLIQHLRSQGIKDEIIQKAGLARSTSEGGLIDLFRRRVLFPIFNPKGEVVGFGGRILSDEDLGPKYLNTPETILFKKSQELFGLLQAKEAIKEKNYFIVTEGYLDVISAHQVGLRNVVAPLGTALTEAQARLLKRYSENVLLVFDSDEAGVNASKRASLVLLSEGLQVKVLLLPRGEDLDSFLKRQGIDAFKRLFPKALGVLDFFLSFKGDRVSNIRALTEAVGKVKDPILRGTLLQELSEKTRVPQEMLLEQIRKKTIPQRPKEDERISTGPSTEELLLALFIGYPDMRQKIINSISEDMFTDIDLRDIFKKVSSSPHLPLQEVLSKEEFKRVSSILVKTQIDEEALEKNLSDLIKALRRQDIKRRILQIQKAISQAERDCPEKVLEYQQILQNLMKEARDEGLF